MVLKEKMLQFIILVFFSFPILICKGNVQSLSPQYLRVCRAVSHPDKHCEPAGKWFLFTQRNIQHQNNPRERYFLVLSLVSNHLQFCPIQLRKKRSVCRFRIGKWWPECWIVVWIAVGWIRWPIQQHSCNEIVALWLQMAMLIMFTITCEMQNCCVVVICFVSWLQKDKAGNTSCWDQTNALIPTSVLADFQSY